MKEPFTDFIKKTLQARTLLITCGLPASGKTTSAEIVAALKGYRIIRSDLIRLEAFKDENIFDEKVAASMNNRMLVYDEMFKKADKLAEKGDGFILDATFITRALRQRAAGVADRYGLAMVIQETICPEKTCIRRILDRKNKEYESNAVTEQAYFNNLKKFEPVDLKVLKKHFPDLSVMHLMVDTSSDVADKWSVIGKTACNCSF